MVKSYFFTGTPLKTDSNDSNTEYTGLENPITEVSSNCKKAIMLQKRRSPMIIAHRGASAFAPENTIAAFRLAAESGCEGIEMDLRLSKDAEAVVIHDKSLRRTGGLDRLVSELSVNELKKIDVGSWFFRKYPKRFRREYSKERVPTLKEVFHELSFYQGIFYLELKGKQSDIPKLAEAVDRAIPEEIRNRVIIKTFKIEQLPTIKSICSGTKLAALFAPKILNVVRKEKRLIRLASQYGADEISLHYTLISRKLVRKALMRGLRIAVWTTDSPRRLRRAASLGLDAVITNDPARLLTARESLNGYRMLV